MPGIVVRMRQVLHDLDLQAELLDVGYVRVPMLDAVEVADLGAELDRLQPDDGFEPDGTGLNRSTYHCTFLDTNTEYKRAVQQLLDRVFQPKIEQLAVDYRILTGNFYVKMPGKGRFQIHQNWPTTEDLSLTTLTIWCPLTDAEDVNGTLRVVPGSHKILPEIATPSRPPFFAGFEEELIEHHLIPISVRAGEALVFDDSLVHWSAENRSTTPRRAVQIETVPIEITPVLYHLDDSGDVPRWEIFEVDGDFFVEHSIDQVIGRPTDLTSIGWAEYANRELTEAEFSALIANGRDIRADVYAGRGWGGRVVD